MMSYSNSLSFEGGGSLNHSAGDWTQKLPTSQVKFEVAHLYSE